MPSERDIRETRDKIERRRYSQTEFCRFLAVYPRQTSSASLLNKTNGA